MMRNALGMAALIIVVGAVHLLTLRDGQEWGDDFSLYVAHARNLAEGRPYADTGFVYNSANAMLSPRTYPPIFPVLLVPIYLLFGMNLLAMKVFVVFLFMVLLGVLAWLLLQRLPFLYALGCLALFALNPYVWQHKDRLLSETPFMLFAYLALILGEKAQRQPTRSRALAWGVLAGVVAYLACGTRTVGVVLLPSFLLCEWMQRRRLGLASLALTLTFLAGVAVQKCLLIVENSYLDQLVFDPVLFARLGLSLARKLGHFLENGSSNAIRLVLYVGLLLPALWSYLSRLRGRLTPCELFAAFNALVLVAWPAAVYERRFLLPILPLFFLYAAEGVRRLDLSSLRRLEKPVAVALVLAVLLSYAACYGRIEAGPVRDGVNSPEAAELFKWVQKESDPQDVFLFQKPRAFALYTGRRSVAHHSADDPPRLAHTLRKHGATHLVVYHASPLPGFQRSGRLIEELIAVDAARFEKVYENRAFRVYRIRDGLLASR